LNEHWIAYLREVQAENEFRNWSSPPYALYQARMSDQAVLSADMRTPTCLHNSQIAASGRERVRAQVPPTF
jgi:hypothetical protein